LPTHRRSPREASGFRVKRCMKGKSESENPSPLSGVFCLRFLGAASRGRIMKSLKDKKFTARMVPFE
jgi:hypothetical protein